MLSFREAKEDDLEAILSLYAVEDIDNGDVLDLDKAKELFLKIMSYPDYKIYLCSLDGRVVGTFSLAIMTNLAHMGASSGLIEDVVVQKEQRSKGIGRDMMAFAIEKCRDKGCYKVSLSSKMTREKAHKFYENIGFKKHGYSFTMELKRPNRI